MSNIATNTSEAISQIISYLIGFFEQVREYVKHYLEIYVFSKNPALASKFGDYLVFLVTLTVIYALIELVEGFKRLLRLIVILGWVLFIVLLAASYIGLK